MSMFQDAHDVVFNGGEFHNSQTQNITYHHGPTGIDILREASTPEAAFDSEERNYNPSCYPGTREQYIDDVTHWASAGGSDNALPIYWMKGPAGVGKSAIAQTCAARLKDAGQLGAAFFFSINGRRKDHTRFFPTLAYQLSTIYDDYRAIVHRKVSVDQTLFKKTIASQFRSLIAEPLHELKEQGRELQKSAIFIDGLDECESRSAQVEIIQIIASFVRRGSTPFCWAIFSREEPHIVSTFTDPTISPHCYSIFLPISREADEEIELYLRGGFRNLLQRRNLLSLSSSWPTAEDMKKLVDAAAGLFAHSATVLRFVDRHSYSGFQESLGVVLASIAKPGTKTPSLYAELDKLYSLILQRIPEDILPTTLLLLSFLAFHGFDSRGWSIANICNVLGISEAIFRSIYHHLQAVLTIQDPPQLQIYQSVALDRSYLDQDTAFNSSYPLRVKLLQVLGSVNFHHKSLYDFITDPNRSSSFCVTTTTAHGNLFNCYIQRHLHYTSTYSIQTSSKVFTHCVDLYIYCGIPELVLAPGVANSSISLSWPQGSEFVDSFLKLQSFCTISYYLSHDTPGFGLFLRDAPLSSLQKLAELDYHKDLIADRALNGLGLRVTTSVAGFIGTGTTRYTDGSTFMYIGEDEYGVFDPAVFLRMVEKLQKLGVIRPYSPRLGSSRAASLLHTFSRQKLSSKKYGQYKLGHGGKSVIWYWEFDPVERYFHEFQTIDFARTMAYYKAEKFNIWEQAEDAFGGEEDDFRN